MATYYWVGGETSASGSYTNGLGGFSGTTGTVNMDWVLAFDWNNPGNWYTRTGNVPNQFFYSKSTRSPGQGDIAIFGSSDFRGGISGGILPIASAPCLWGGASVSGSTTTWRGAGTSGATQTNGNSFAGGIAEVRLGGGRPGTQYPFQFWGADGFANSVLGASSETSPLYNAQTNGFTLNTAVWGGASWDSLVAAVAATGATAVARLDKVSLKAALWRSDDYAGTPFGFTGTVSSATLKNVGKVRVDFLKNLALIGSSGGVTSGNVSTTFVNQGIAEHKLSGVLKSIASAVDYNLFPTFFHGPTPFYAPRPILALVGVTCGEVGIITTDGGGSYFVDATSNIAEAAIFSSSNYFFGQFQNKFDRVAVLAEIFPGITQPAGNSLSPELAVSNYTTASPFATPSGGGGSVNYYGIILGAPGTTMTANRVEIGSVLAGVSGSSGPQSILRFGGNCKINSLQTAKTHIAAWELGADKDQTNIDIGELELANSTLDLSNVAPIDTWSFGTIGATGQISGGIVFLDENSIIRGSQGVRLWNEQLLFGGQALKATAPNKISGTITSSPTVIN